MKYPRIASLKTPEAFTAHLEALGVELPYDEKVEAGAHSPLGRPMVVDGHRVGNRFCILPMEGWDGTASGAPTELHHRRWANFGRSGAKWIWGGEAVAVRHDGRANPNQLVLSANNADAIAGLRQTLVDTHAADFGDTDDLFVGLQLTHSGRYARPNVKTRPEPRTAHRHPVLDARLGIRDDSALLSDDDLTALVEDFVDAAVRAQQAGFAFVDVKHCHGYLGHELLAARRRGGRYGGNLAARTRFLAEITEGIDRRAPGLAIGVRLSIFDFAPFRPGDDGVGRPEPDSDPALIFAAAADGLAPDLDQTSELIEVFERLGITMVCTTAGSPYYNPHIQRPATFPPSDGYGPPEDPLVGVARQIHAVAELKRRHPAVTFVGSGYTYLQDHLPSVAQAVVRRGMADSVGLGRMVLSYPQLPADVIAGRDQRRKLVCRTFSDCTTAPRNGLISGCYPLDRFYKALPEHATLKELKKA